MSVREMMLERGKKGFTKTIILCQITYHNEVIMTFGSSFKSNTSSKNEDSPDNIQRNVTSPPGRFPKMSSNIKGI